MRDTSQLHPELQKKLKQLVKQCEKEGLKIGISECLRTTKEQDDLYAQGRTKPGTIVTNCMGKTYSSMHQWGVAFDFYRNDGKGAYNTSGKFFEKVGAIGRDLGLEWGGDWKSFRDMPHFQLPDWGSTAVKLKAKYGRPENFFKTWSNGGESADKASKSDGSSKIKYTVTAKSGLKLRNKPSAISSTIVVMPSEATFVYANEKSSDGKWLKGTYGKKMGWASAKYLRKSK
jgi:hypothetical protein